MGWGEAGWLVCLFACLVWFGFLYFFMHGHNFTARVPPRRADNVPKGLWSYKSQVPSIAMLFSKQSRNAACRVFSPNISGEILPGFEILHLSSTELCQGDAL